MSDNKYDVTSYLKKPQSLISFIKNSPDHWLVKDNEARYVFVNNAASEFFRFPKKFNPEGKTDKDVPTEICQELWPEFVNGDLRVIAENRRMVSIAIHHYGKGNTGELVPHYVEKVPLYDDENKIIGIVTNGRRLEVPTLLYYMNRLNRKIIKIDAPNDVFTKRELEVIFWAQQRLSVKEIAKRLNISPNTVDVHLMNIYYKADVHNILQLIDYCRDVGLDKYIPLDFIRKGVQLIE